jgi:hypothetical protein
MHRKNHIEHLVHHGSVVIDEQQKSEVIFQHFDEIVGKHGSCSHGLDFVALGLPIADLLGLDFCFSEEEIWNVVRQLSPDKAPGPDGFTGRFYQCAWSVIKQDILRAFNAFWSLDHRSFYLVNQTYVTSTRSP